MTAITLPPDLEAWARAEVAAGRGASIEEVAKNAITRYRVQMEKFRRSLDEAEAEADREGALDAEAVFAELKARYADPV
jgi:Arc/MetJ-type ribon-helix-helix transcriptional regulator